VADGDLYENMSHKAFTTISKVVSEINKHGADVIGIDREGRYTEHLDDIAEKVSAACGYILEFTGSTRTGEHGTEIYKMYKKPSLKNKEIPRIPSKVFESNRAFIPAPPQLETIPVAKTVEKLSKQKMAGTQNKRIITHHYDGKPTNNGNLRKKPGDDEETSEERRRRGRRSPPFWRS
jgi:hypothetical protein